jgi:hypothetical protein
MGLTTALQTLFIETATTLKGFARHRFHAQTVKALGPGGQRLAERALGWDRTTIRTAMHALESGLQCFDTISTRRRKRAEEHLPHLLDAITAMVDSQSQTDPHFHSRRLSPRMTSAEVRRQLMTQTGYADTALPTVRTITTKLNDPGYHSMTVAKVKPKKGPRNRRHRRTHRRGECRC